MKTKHFNLLYEDWIPVIYHNRSYKHLSILEVFKEAHNIRQIGASNPLDRFSIFRFFLALLYWCKGNPDKENILDFTHFPEEWFLKLKDNEDCFNLFGNGKRFFQFGGYNPKKDILLSVNQIMHEIPSGTNIFHFRHSIDGINGLCPNCIALGLLRLPVFTTQGGQGKAPGINLKPPVYMIPVGSTLLETLLLSYRPVENLGEPSWLFSDMQIPVHGDITFLMGLTGLPRRVWLMEPVFQSECVLCGQKDNLIVESVYAGIQARSGASQWEDPHVLYYQDKKGMKSFRGDDPRKIWFISERPWAKLLSAIFGSKKFKQVKYNIIAFITDQVKYIDVWERDIIISYDDANRLIDLIENWNSEMNNLLKKVKYQRRNLPQNKYSLLRNIRPHIEFQMSSKLNDIIIQRTEPYQEIKPIFEEIMHLLSISLSPGYNSSDTYKRFLIKNSIPFTEQTKGDAYGTSK